jgi:hypothetical protein
MFMAHQPIGERCYCNVMQDTGVRNAWNFSIREVNAEVERLRAGTLDERLSEAQHADYLSRLTDLLHDAMAGRLTFAKPDNQAEVMHLVPHVVELRPMPDKRQGEGAPNRLLRLYLAEPLLHSKSLLALHLATKPNGEDVAKEQNAAVLEAGARASAWASRQ